jgi:hypothetical protein
VWCSLVWWLTAPLSLRRGREGKGHSNMTDIAGDLGQRMSSLTDLQSTLVNRFMNSLDYLSGKEKAKVAAAWLASGGLHEVLYADSGVSLPKDAVDENEPIALIRAERERQIASEGWTAEHDDQWLNGELATAAAYYALPAEAGTPPLWPWACEWNKKEKHNRLRQLVIAGALIVAEIERLQRHQASLDTEIVLGVSPGDVVKSNLTGVTVRIVEEMHLDPLVWSLVGRDDEEE